MKPIVMFMKCEAASSTVATDDLTRYSYDFAGRYPAKEEGSITEVEVSIETMNLQPFESGKRYRVTIEEV